LPTLYDFQVQRPEKEVAQKVLLAWIANAHARAEATRLGLTLEDPAIQDFHQKIHDKFYALGVGEDKIQSRGAALSDYFSDDREIYDFEKHSSGRLLGDRMKCYDHIISNVMRRFYPEGHPEPSPHLIHVSCTGYVSPSPAQKIVSERQWGQHTRVTHAYHMGCYASIPAVQIALGNFHANHQPSDIVHTEFSGLHLNPSLHTTEQLVIESLFADGFIRYSLGSDGAKGFEIITVAEEIIPDTQPHMRWRCAEWGFEMTIAKEVPVMIARHLPGYLERLAKKAGIPLTDLAKARYAIHPGGPKIIHQIAKKLALEPWQFSHSQKILASCGNMSSATLPHVWNEMLEDDEVRAEELIVSLAFGPGLTFAGALFKKRS
jgi:predicted naringenin-chalcone synthase